MEIADKKVEIADIRVEIADKKVEIADIVYFGTRSQPRLEVDFRPLKLIKTYLKLIKTPFRRFRLVDNSA